MQYSVSSKRQKNFIFKNMCLVLNELHVSYFQKNTFEHLEGFDIFAVEVFVFIHFKNHKIHFYIIIQNHLRTT